MEGWPSDLSPEAAQTLEAAGQHVRDRALDRCEAILTAYEETETAQFVYDRAFSPNDLFPKRQRRPKTDSALLTEQVYREFGTDESTLDALLDLSILSQEYYDILDDAVDGDVAPDRDGEAILTSQLLLPRIHERLAVIHPDASTFWAGRIERLVTAPQLERTTEPSEEAYLALLDRQSNLYGALTGLAALAADTDDATVDDAERLGRTIYKHDHFVHDRLQFEDGRREEWNAAALLSEEEVVDRLRAWRETVEELTASFDDERATILRGLVALDIDAWRGQ